MKKKLELRGACAAKLGNTHSVRKVAGGVNQKVKCEECGRNRYGGTFEVEAKKRGERDG